ncbi:MAG: phage holin family protein [Polyangiaceae bacterium]|nr:phage holin family protein [Myxococcales bacterium]MCB9585800.1 phage holin family protein [Polyangiaceae bacterium]MCB9607271.1 phage holin family protein [Polyangiaceae bacterium]
MNAPLPSESTPALVRELLLDMKDLALKELEVSKLQARDELKDVVRRVFLGLGALGMALIVVAMLAFASALGLSRASHLPLELSMLVIASVPTLAAVALYAKTRKVKKHS